MGHVVILPASALGGDDLTGARWAAAERFLPCAFDSTPREADKTP
jgi:hypothetical protein